MNDNTFYDILRSYNNGQLRQCRDQIKKGGKRKFMRRLLDDTKYLSSDDKVAFLKKVI